MQNRVETDPWLPLDVGLAAMLRYVYRRNSPDIRLNGILDWTIFAPVAWQLSSKEVN